jgi:hypothetical protein
MSEYNEICVTILIHVCVVAGYIFWEFKNIEQQIINYMCICSLVVHMEL